MVLTNDPAIAARAKHLTTTAKLPHAYEFIHDQVGFNYRLPNLNAALGCAQMETLPAMLEIKADVAARYRAFCLEHGLRFLDAPVDSRPNYWLNAIILSDIRERDALLEYSNAKGIMMRPIWRLMSELAMFANCENDGLEVSRWLADRVVNLPSSVPDGELTKH
jgi:dTDP-4-amino-4,6-dideoxygalactose transaminase